MKVYTHENEKNVAESTNPLEFTVFLVINDSFGRSFSHSHTMSNCI